MYSFMVTSEVGTWDSREYAYARERFCEYTSDELKNQFHSLDPAAIKALLAMPCLFAYEGNMHPMRVGHVKRISDRGTTIYFEFDLAHEIPAIPFSEIDKLKLPLDIKNRNELTRTHWAIKNEDLLAILRRAALAPADRPPVDPRRDSSRPRGTGKWHIVRSLDPGYQGEVFLVTAPDHVGHGVLKRLPLRRRDPHKAQIRFLREIAILNSLKHPCIVRTLGASTKGDDPWLVTEFAPFGSMNDQVATLAGDPWRCLRVARDLAAALGAAHSKGIIHRDVKPKNILFFSLDRPVVADFGIAHDADATSITSANERVGARGYAPPEWETGHIQPTAAFDVYSLGKLIYFMLSGGVCPARERYREREYDLVERLGRPELELVNKLLDQMVVERIDGRLQTMNEVIRAIDRTLIEMFGPSPSPANTCRLCLRGTYRKAGSLVMGAGAELLLKQSQHHFALKSFDPAIVTCDRCGDARLIFETLGGLKSGPEWSGPVDGTR